MLAIDTNQLLLNDKVKGCQCPCDLGQLGIKVRCNKLWGAGIRCTSQCGGKRIGLDARGPSVPTGTRLNCCLTLNKLLSISSPQLPSPQKTGEPPMRILFYLAGGWLTGSCLSSWGPLSTDGGELLPSSRLLPRSQAQAKTMESDFQSEEVIQSQNQDQICPAT